MHACINIVLVTILHIPSSRIKLIYTSISRTLVFLNFFKWSMVYVTDGRMSSHCSKYFLFEYFVSGRERIVRGRGRSVVLGLGLVGGSYVYIYTLYNICIVCEVNTDLHPVRSSRLLLFPSPVYAVSPRVLVSYTS